ncbi:beta-ketoacyl synthase N-terminal-like domain-containing protein [Streptomyces sp. NPDC002589]|uniref:beta-ketoacyl synthase N-terminal-like domain-containing protein n=1 Tax=Streptomyces sp. NPDC002589 TaxID=3154420 RepID=UPI003328216F
MARSPSHTQGIDVHTPTPSPSATSAAVTAVGAVTASGTSVAALFDDMLRGRRPFTEKEIPLVANAIPAPPGRAAESSGRVVFAAHVQAPLDLTEVVGARAERAFGRDSRLLLYAMHIAGAAPVVDADRTGVVLGTLRAGRNEYIAIHNASAGTGGPVNPVWGPQSGYNAPAAQLSIHLPARGPNLTLSSGATAGLDAVVTGVQQVSMRVWDYVVAAGLDTLSAAAVEAGDELAGPRGPYEPRPGDVPEGEAAAVLVLEDAPADDDRVLARILGTGRAAAAPGVDLARAAEEAVRAALRQVGCESAEVGLAVATAGGDRAAEAAERAALAVVFGKALPVCNATGTTGRTGGADGVLAVAVAVEALNRGVVPPIAGLRADPVPPAGPLALCLSVERGGNATAVLLGGAAERKAAA